VIKRGIRVQEAVVRTATVEIKTLTVGGRQVTLALFRQLPYSSIIDASTLGLRGVPWGTVNYHFDKCFEEYPIHIHVVWQEGRELRHDLVPSDGSRGAGVVADALARRQSVTECWLLDEALTGSAITVDHSRHNSGTAGTKVPLHFVPLGTISLLEDPYGTFRRQKRAEQLHDWLGVDAVTIQDMEAACRELIALQAAYKEIYDQLASLDQLFIAV
jgi:hypothetical protein